MKYYHAYYVGFTAEQFAGDMYFREWVLFEDSDKNKFWNAYLRLNPEQQEKIVSARMLVESSLEPASMQPLTEEEKQILKSNIYQKINRPSGLFSMPSQKSLRLLNVAAIIFGIIIIPVYFLTRSSATEALIVERTGDKETREIMLPDSTVVILNANSSIAYDNEIGSAPDRKIQLAGNAYFKVKKKADHRSFTVHTNALSIAVLGTEFNVNARTKATEIVLTAGKIKVSLDNNSKEPVYMSPGEKLELDTVYNVFVKTKTDTLLYSAWTDGKWNFNSTTLKEITDLINKYYGIKTVYTVEKTKLLKISAVVPVTDLNSFTNILAKTLDLEIKEINNQLIIQ